ncbi:MAG: hypothetical protein ACTXOO_00025 [Sodalis sp. (in: enterobacteria)]
MLHVQAAYRHDSTAILSQLCRAPSVTLLLELAKIDKKYDLESVIVVNSMMPVSSALLINVLGQTITLQALSPNGAKLFLLLDAAFPQQVMFITHLYRRELTFPETEQPLDKGVWLRSLYIFDCLRLLLTLVSRPLEAQKATFIGALVAYNLVAGFKFLLPLR